MFSEPEADKIRLCSLWACVLIIVLLPSGFLAAQSGSKKESNLNPQETSAPSYKGGLVTPPLPKPKFTLTDTSGAQTDFWKKTEGHVTLLFFGYTRCPDECPLHMANIAAALKLIPASVADQIKVVFVTTDPGRDTREILRLWLDRFDKRFIGLTGSQAAVDAAQHAAAIPVAQKALLSNRDYQVAHASFVIAYTKDNLAHVIYPGGVTQKDWAQDLPRLEKETWSSH
jgi:protein SCO1/2